MKRTAIFVVPCAVFAILFALLFLPLGTDVPPTETSTVIPSAPPAQGASTIPDISYTPPAVEKAPTQSQPPGESKPEPWAIVKVASELPLLTPEPTKTVAVPGKTVTATYYGKGYQEFANTTPYYAYATDDGDVLRYDAVGGELIYYERAKKPKKEEMKEQKAITIDEAQKIAETFVREHINLSRYKPTGAHTLMDGTFTFQYVWYVGDMPTQDIINVYIAPTGDLLQYRAIPHLFDCVWIGTADRAALRQRFEEELRAKGGGMDYTLYGDIIGLNSLGEPCAKYEYYYDRNDGRLIAIEGIEIPLTRPSQ
ncbi:MAG: hypothetical protein E7541_05770 [Ruminococcaceae bacterium]|nr:hypothetical protein [Oscillospiraceae bacterium]